MLQFIKLNKKPLKVSTQSNGKDYFRFKNKKYYLDTFLRVHNNAWFNSENYPDFIHGIRNDYYNSYCFTNLCIEIIEGYEIYVNVYELKKEQ